MSRFVRSADQRSEEAGVATSVVSSASYRPGLTVDSFCVAAVNTFTESNGGYLCNWTPPIGTQWATFEVWGGGGPGAGTCQCSGATQGAGGGAFSKRTIDVVPGKTYTICAAGSTRTFCEANPGTYGFASYVTTDNGGTTIVCASGGFWACSECSFAQAQSVCGCHAVRCSCQNTLGDVNFPAVTGWSRSAYECSPNYFSVAQPGAFAGGARFSMSGCCVAQGSRPFINPDFPGGGGSTHASCAYYQNGGYGAGGLVIVTYGVSR